MKIKAFSCIVFGAALWGTIGWFVKHLYTHGLTPMEVVSIRAFSAAVILLVYMLITGAKKLKLAAVKDIGYFIGTGILSIIFFNYCMFTAIELTTIPAATALLYTAPAFVCILSVFLFKEQLTKMKALALLITLVGICFVVGLLPGDISSIGTTGVLFGLGSGIGYALYSIFSKFALKKYSSLQITTFTFLVAAIALLPFFPFAEKGHLFGEPDVLFFAVGLGALPTAFAYIIYTYGLHHTDASNASILTTVEPVVATIIGIFVFAEPFSWVQSLGMACIISAVILIQWSSGKSKSVGRKTTLKKIG
ncbi:EamA family transporter [Virgibacillus sp. 179-BFC.A HS]|uniref:EamA family transporter n=1 Tax=Tigheibacillus jepli TaxID=3035914 RepID=A0ABU5CJQ8_9BACI|nr:EamA family transporter [Virgibacillus sp. 179-BFC.A HS]MDY0406034.1 EamA family transporter [Virgibacillus sp. 179-BFC.A HS]